MFIALTICPHSGQGHALSNLPTHWARTRAHQSGHTLGTDTRSPVCPHTGQNKARERDSADTLNASHAAKLFAFPEGLFWGGCRGGGVMKTVMYQVVTCFRLRTELSRTMVAYCRQKTKLVIICTVHLHIITNYVST